MQGMLGVLFSFPLEGLLGVWATACLRPQSVHVTSWGFLSFGPDTVSTCVLAASGSVLMSRLPLSLTPLQ